MSPFFNFFCFCINDHGHYHGHTTTVLSNFAAVFYNYQGLTPANIVLFIFLFFNANCGGSNRRKLNPRNSKFRRAIFLLSPNCFRHFPLLGFLTQKKIVSPPAGATNSSVQSFFVTTSPAFLLGAALSTRRCCSRNWSSISQSVCSCSAQPAT